MDQMNWTTRWETWRTLMGAPSSLQRKRVEAFLQTRPSLLYWGDSWFSTPLYLNLARQSILGIDGMAMLIGKPGATASELFLVRLRYWLVCGGMITRNACGTTTKRRVWPRVRPSEPAASHCPLLTARMPERTISAMKEPV